MIILEVAREGVNNLLVVAGEVELVAQEALVAVVEPFVWVEAVAVASTVLWRRGGGRPGARAGLRGEARARRWNRGGGRLRVRAR